MHFEMKGAYAPKNQNFNELCSYRNFLTDSYLFFKDLYGVKLRVSLSNDNGTEYIYFTKTNSKRNRRHPNKKERNKRETQQKGNELPQQTELLSF
jgi:hypothetical protein